MALNVPSHKSQYVFSFSGESIITFRFFLKLSKCVTNQLPTAVWKTNAKESWRQFWHSFFFQHRQFSGEKVNHWKENERCRISWFETSEKCSRNLSISVFLQMYIGIKYTYYGHPMTFLSLHIPNILASRADQTNKFRVFLVVPSKYITKTN